MTFHTNLYDEQGNQIKPPICLCGKVCDTCLMGVKYLTWTCYECIVKEAKSQTLGLVYRPPNYPGPIAMDAKVDDSHIQMMSAEVIKAYRQTQIKHLESLGFVFPSDQPILEEEYGSSDNVNFMEMVSEREMAAIKASHKQLKEEREGDFPNAP